MSATTSAGDEDDVGGGRKAIMVVCRMPNDEGGYEVGSCREC